ncbi:hypothetical protein K505DRAFT_349155 [Melanomma pulvis-pyrius CBS 109.77]|uniref:Uncharacterized protein n=1 Tax=Melanomma pulvis-pyrius CBS 109.77 TaxID=1314802 RepID=A0A6A6XEY0_9PLEO|nr:hypothetical protein K505DRAFT_349155 [Melanomma pulvis-pyrius CBS 109.77]
MAVLTISTISLDTFNAILSRYTTTAPAKLVDLDTLRYVTVPTKLAERKKDGDAFLEKAEVEGLVEWKLKHGTFRPKLLQLVQSNPSPLIHDTTRSAFASLDPTSPLPALKSMTSLKGIGPATASLLLAVFDPEAVPFFSDELLRWVTWEEGGGWKRKIKYDVKEYAVLVQGVGKLRERLGVKAVDVERVAWVLGREGRDVGAGGGEGGEKTEEEVTPNDGAKKSKSVKGKDETKVVGKGVKRKTEDGKTSEGARRSTRRKTAT